MSEDLTFLHNNAIPSFYCHLIQFKTILLLSLLQNHNAKIHRNTEDFRVLHFVFIRNSNENCWNYEKLFDELYIYRNCYRWSPQIHCYMKWISHSCIMIIKFNLSVHSSIFNIFIYASFIACNENSTVKTHSCQEPTFNFVISCS